MTADYWQGLPTDEQDRLREIAIKYRDLVPGIGPGGTIYDAQTACALVEILDVAADLSAEHTYWLQLSNDVLGAYTDWLARTRRKFERNGWPWTTEELARRSRLWEVE